MTISEIEKKLAEYRSKKEREAVINHYKEKASNIFSAAFESSKKKNADQNYDAVEEEQFNLLQDTNIDKEIDSDNINSKDNVQNILENKDSFIVSGYLYHLLLFFLWTILYMVFIKLEFGIIYLIVSALIGMYLNTRTEPKMKSEVSAYSVFNENCESIEGTLKAEQLTKEILYGGFR